MVRNIVRPKELPPIVPGPPPEYRGTNGSADPRPIGAASARPRRTWWLVSALVIAGALLAGWGILRFALGISAGDARSPYQQLVLADTPASYWRLGETRGTTAADQRNAVPCAYLGGYTLDRSGAVGGDDPGVALDGISGYVNCGDHFDFAGRAAFSLELWVFPTAIDDSYRRLISKDSYDAGQSPPAREGYTLGYQREGGLTFGRYAGQAENEITYAPGLTPNAWNHVVATYDGSMLHLYLNGREVASAGSDLQLADTELQFSIGRMTGGGSNAAGRLDEVAVYGRALPAERVQAHYRAGNGQ